MAENKTNPEVELDTDGVNEETVIVDAPEVSTEAFEKKQEVDLGYIDVSGGKSAKELLNETKEVKNQNLNLNKKKKMRTQVFKTILKKFKKE
jgi:hypothetical protein